MKRSENIQELATALSKAQSVIKPAVKDSVNPHFKSNYADLSSAWNACRDALTKNGLAIVQSPSTTENGLVRITTLLLHASGQYLEDDLILTPRDASPQSYGSCVSYGRRYALMAFVGIAAEDDDGNLASQVNPLGRPAPLPPSSRGPNPPIGNKPRPPIQAGLDFNSTP